MKKLHPMQPTISVSTQTEEASDVLNSSCDKLDWKSNLHNISQHSISSYNFISKLNNNSSASTVSKLNKVIIYNIREKAYTSDILTAISDKIGDVILSINFLKKSIRKSLNKFNYIIELPQKTSLF